MQEIEDQIARLAVLRSMYQGLLDSAAKHRMISPAVAASGRVQATPLSWLLAERVARARELGIAKLSILSSLFGGATKALDKGLDATVLIVQIERLLPRADGYLEALADVAVERSKVANRAKTKRAEGRTEEIRRRFEAKPWSSKSQAATKIAGDLGMSPEVVRRHLTKLYPGDTWKEPRVSSKPPAGG